MTEGLLISPAMQLASGGAEVAVQEPNVMGGYGPYGIRHRFPI